jgi:membrane-bound lytic murein transglycosylase D
MDTVLVDNSYSLNQLALKLNMSVNELKEYNPALRRGVIPFSNEKIALTLPYNKAMAFTNANADSGFKTEMNNEVIALNKEIQRENQSRKATIQYKVRRGEQLASIASKYDVTVKDIKKWNNLKSNKVKAGQRLKIKSNQA